MTERLFVVRIADRSAALERVLGVLRRRRMAVRRLSVTTADGVFELMLRVDTAQTPPERVQAELLNLVDVHDVRESLQEDSP